MAAAHTPRELTEQMFATVGRAITQWSFVENELCKLFAVCIGCARLTRIAETEAIEQRWTGMALFYAIENWRTKLQLVDAALEAHVVGTPVQQDLIAEWEKLSEKANKLARKRNKLAHWFVRPAQRTGTGEAHEPIAPARLCPLLEAPTISERRASTPRAAR